MAYRNLADFLDDLGRAGELAPIDAEVDPCLEIAEVTRRVARQNGPALLFRNVKGHDIPLVTKLFGTEARILRALGADSIEEATARIDRALNGGGSEGWLERLRFGGKGGAAASFAANRVKSGACQQVVQIGSDINLLGLPVLNWGEPLKTSVIHSAIAISAEPETHAQVFLRCDLQITGRDTAVAVWSDVADPVRLMKAHFEAGSRMPLAIVVGGDPAVQLAYAAPLPSSVDPLGLAGLMREKPLDAAACRSIDLLVPAESDYVIEGYIDAPANENIIEPRLPMRQLLAGQLGHVMHVTAVTHRVNCVFPAMIPSVSVNEFSVLTRVVAKLYLPYLKLRIPELVDFDLPLSGGARHLAFVAIDKSYSDQARRVATIAWGMRPFEFTRLLVVVDADVDVRDTEQVVTAILHKASWIVDVWNLDRLPHRPYETASWEWIGRRLAIDTTRDFAEDLESESRVVQDQRVETLVTERWAEYGLGPESEL